MRGAELTSHIYQAHHSDTNHYMADNLADNLADDLVGIDADYEQVTLAPKHIMLETKIAD